ncbi:hypothetical protein AVEN_250531-1 [Araneus ventricosus]|uniref:Uncharacterized protein n=1 Tax=Araneus ventricosus TaxID=182803 RepID=A0A4Y2FVH5_ARAVE|nr:hypothetical protein AVEN_250531-1 [Araneus ventricosus]
MSCRTPLANKVAVLSETPYRSHSIAKLGGLNIALLLSPTCSWYQNNFNTVKFKRNDRVQPLALISDAIKVHDEGVSINPTTLFQIIYITKQSYEELEDVLTFELCPFPLPLFDEAVMRKGMKSSLYNAFKPRTRDFNAESGVYIIGGYLLHRVIWKRGSTFSSICDNYVTYVRTKYKSTALVIFDGVATWLRFAAAHQHSLKVYYQIQHWLGDKKRPGDWGWERTNSELQPVKTLKSPAPDSILYARYPASGNCNNKGIQVINSDDDGEPIVPDDLVETSLSLHVKEDTGGLSKDIGP